MNAVLHHDLSHDMHSACHHLIARKVGAPTVDPGLSAVQVVTPFNVTWEIDDPGTMRTGHQFVS